MTSPARGAELHTTALAGVSTVRVADHMAHELVARASIAA